MISAQFGLNRGKRITFTYTTYIDHLIIHSEPVNNTKHMAKSSLFFRFTTLLIKLHKVVTLVLVILHSRFK